jgi:hypothetical protein
MKKHYPAAFANVIAVAATDENDVKAPFSNFGDWVDLSAPGVNIYSTDYDDAYQYRSGSSMAAPYVASLAANLLSLNPEMKTAEIENKIKTTSVKIDNQNTLYRNLLGAGRINVYKALDLEEVSVAKEEVKEEAAQVSVPAADPMAAPITASTYTSGEILNYPNPFNPSVHGSTRIVYSLAAAQDVDLRIFDVTGNLIYKQAYYADSTGGSNGDNEVLWDGRNSFGEVASNGVYFCMLTSRSHLIARGKIIVVR